MYTTDKPDRPPTTRGGTRTACDPVEGQQRWRVSKKLLPGQPGTLKLLRRYGEALLCVRYRRDDQGLQRCTTVELVVERVLVQPRPDEIVGVRLRYDEGALRAKVRTRGAQWDQHAKVWRMPYRAAVGLGLKDRIVEKQPAADIHR